MITNNGFSSFEDIIEHLTKTEGSLYERKKKLARRHIKGKKHTVDFGTITYVTDDGRIGLLWAFQTKGTRWIFIYPSKETIEYFRDQAPKHIKAILENNKR